MGFKICERKIEEQKRIIRLLDLAKGEHTLKPIAVEVDNNDDVDEGGNERLLRAVIKDEFAGKRVDQTLASLFSDISRSNIQQWIRDGRVLIDGQVPRQRDSVSGGETVTIALPEAEPGDWVAQDISLNIVFQDEHILVVNKPVGLVVHPGAGNAQGTMLNGLIHFDPALATLPRGGIVHRLDKDTSGLLVIARSEPVRQRLIEALQAHSVQRTYIAIVQGSMISGASIDAPIGRHYRDRKRMTVTDTGKTAVTHYRVAERYRAHTKIQVFLETGRTHQIRVHMSHAGFPLLGDSVYGGRLRLPPNATKELTEVLRSFNRQALHASKLEFEHPASGKLVHWSAPLPEDMTNLIAVLQDDTQKHGMQD